MRNTLFLVCVSVLTFQLSFSQDQGRVAPSASEVDSIPQNGKNQGVVIEDGTYKKAKINPLAPSKAAFYSAILPGLGQIYNKRYWKVPIVYAALGAGLYIYADRNKEYNRVRDAFKRRLAGFTDDEFFDLNGDGNGPDVSSEALQSAQESTQRDRDLALIVTIAVYALNIIDANVDAHLKHYNVSDDLTMDIKPYLDINPLTQTPNYGATLVLQF